MNGDSEKPLHLLRAAYDDLFKEIYRIEKLLEQGRHDDSDEIAQQAIGHVNDGLQSLIGEAEEEIFKINQVILAEGRGDDVSEADVAEAWKAYTEVRTRIMPLLVNDLLAVYGGLYAQSRKLDNVTPHGLLNEDETEYEPVSFSEIAAELVSDDLSKRSRKGWESVLIVGEEQLRHSEAEIIRLRFPACDIWHLPFTAHEYGYIVARKNTKAPKDLLDLIKQIRGGVMPGDDMSQRTNRDLYLPDVVDLWDQYDRDIDKDAFLHTHRHRFYLLEEQQEALLCRLFADAFATLFVGPAYVYALLHYHFLPEDGPLSTMPPFSPRLVFAFETLTWMNDTPPVNPSRNQSEFNDIISTLPQLREASYAAAGKRDPYKESLEKYRAWWEKTIEALMPFSFKVEETYENWKKAKDLMRQLKVDGMKVPERPDNAWITLNAAWHLRWQLLTNPGTVDYTEQLIERNAVRLLNKNDTGVLEKSQEARSPSQEVRDPEQLKQIVRSALRDMGEAVLLERFVEMEENDALVRDEEITMALLEGKKREALTAFRKVTPRAR